MGKTRRPTREIKAATGSGESQAPASCASCSDKQQDRVLKKQVCGAGNEPREIPKKGKLSDCPRDK